MQRCTVCGAKVPDRARFCNNCGHTLKPADVHTVTVNPRKIKGGPPRDNLATVSNHSLSDAGMKEQKQVAAAAVDTPSIGTSRPPEIPPISEIPTSTLLDSVAEEGNDTARDDEFSAPSSAEQSPQAEAKPQVTAPTSVTASVQSPSAPTPKRTARSNKSAQKPLRLCRGTVVADALEEPSRSRQRRRTRSASEWEQSW